MKRGLVLTGIAVSLSGCSVFNQSNKDYLNARETPALTVPSQVGSLEKSDRFAIPNVRVPQLTKSPNCLPPGFSNEQKG